MKQPVKLGSDLEVGDVLHRKGGDFKIISVSKYEKPNANSNPHKLRVILFENGSAMTVAPDDVIPVVITKRL